MNILVIAPHPDDETLGCGGCLLKHKDQGDKLFWLIMTKMSARTGYTEDQIRVRSEEINKVAGVYDMMKVFYSDFVTTTLDTVPRLALTHAVENVVREVQPNVVYLPNRSDAHSDHRLTFDATMSSIKTFRNSSIKRALMYEVLSETEFAPPLPSEAFVPNGFSDITTYLEKKIEIMCTYRSEMKPHPFPRSEEGIRALATFRGAMSGFKYAESFMVLRDIW